MKKGVKYLLTGIMIGAINLAPAKTNQYYAQKISNYSLSEGRPSLGGQLIVLNKAGTTYTINYKDANKNHEPDSGDGLLIRKTKKFSRGGKIKIITELFRDYNLDGIINNYDYYHKETFKFDIYTKNTELNKYSSKRDQNLIDINHKYLQTLEEITKIIEHK